MSHTLFNRLFNSLLILLAVSISSLASAGNKSATPDVASSVQLVYVAGQLVPATPDGKPWPRCTEFNCNTKSLQFRKPVLAADSAIGRGDIPLSMVAQQVPSINAARSLGATSSASASGSDGNCTIWWVIYPPGIFIPYYDPNDPDCPP